MAISRARDAALLVTDDAHRLADQLERATGARLAALDATARQAAHEAVFGRGTGHDQAADHVTRASDAIDRGAGPDRGDGRGHERGDGIERNPSPEPGRDHDGKPQNRGAGRERAGPDVGKPDLGKGPGDESRQETPRQSELERAAEPKQRSRDLDMDM